MCDRVKPEVEECRMPDLSTILPRDMYLRECDSKYGAEGLEITRSILRK